MAKVIVPIPDDLKQAPSDGSFLENITQAMQGRRRPPETPETPPLTLQERLAGRKTATQEAATEAASKERLPLFEDIGKRRRVLFERSPASSPAVEKLKEVAQARITPDTEQQVEELRRIDIPAPEKSVFQRVSDISSKLNPFTGETTEVGISRDEAIAGAMIAILPKIIGQVFEPRFQDKVASAGPEGLKFLTSEILKRPERRARRVESLLKTSRALEKEDFSRSVELSGLNIEKQKLINELLNQGMSPEAAARSIIDTEKLAQGQEKIELERQDTDLKKKDFKQFQTDAARKFQEMNQANDQFERVRQKGYDPNAITDNLIARVFGENDVSARAIQLIAPGELGPQTELIREAMAAELSFITPLLRKESGAAISPSEWINTRRRFFPKAGDPLAVQVNKAAIRLGQLDGLKNTAGPALSGLTSAAVIQERARRKVKGVQPKPKKRRPKKSNAQKLKDMEERAKRLGIKVK